jgi:hypothetical protein
MERQRTFEENKEINTKSETIENITHQIDESLESPEQSKAFVEQRVEALEKESTPREISVANRYQKGFINPDSEVKRNMLFDGFKINDKELYVTLMETYAEFKNSPSWEGKSTRDMTLYAIQYAIGKYFGNHSPAGNTEQENQSFYMDHSTYDSEAINLEDLKGKNIAVCAEKAAAAQNLLAFAGAESEMVLSESELNPGKKEFHLFNVIKSSKGHFIFDPTNPQHNNNKETNSTYFLPALYPIDEEKYNGLMQGEDVEVEHTDLVIDAEGQHPTKTKRVYGGLKSKK